MEPTPGELVMLGRLRMSQLHFQQQQPVGPYIVDFLIPCKLVIIEVDGGYHCDPEQIVKDVQRDEYLMEMGFTVLHVLNERAATFDMLGVCAWPDVTAQEMGRVMGKAGYRATSKEERAVSAKRREKKRRKLERRRAQRRNAHPEQKKPRFSLANWRHTADGLLAPLPGDGQGGRVGQGSGAPL